MTTREKLHRLIDELSEAEAEAALIRLARDREAIDRWAEEENAEAVEDTWAPSRTPGRLLTRARRSVRSLGSPRRSSLARARRRGTPAGGLLTRDEALPRLRNVVVALVTRTIRGIETEVELGPADGMPVATTCEPCHVHC